MKVHHIKLTQPYFQASASGDKSFEIRLNDRGYAVGDIVLMQLFGEDGFKNYFTGGTISYITSLDILAIDRPDFVVFSLSDRFTGSLTEGAIVDDIITHLSQEENCYTLKTFIPGEEVRL